MADSLSITFADAIQRFRRKRRLENRVDLLQIRHPHGLPLERDVLGMTVEAAKRTGCALSGWLLPFDHGPSYQSMGGCDNG